MIPKLKPYYNIEEVRAALSFGKEAIPKFEEEFAGVLGFKHALSFALGRSSLYAFLKVMGVKNSEAIMPAYTCVVAPNAVVLSGNKPAFVDKPDLDFNMDLKKAKERIGKETKAIIPTSLFGYPVNIDELKEFQERGILVFHDSALGYMTKCKGRTVAKQGDGAMFSLGIGKQLSALNGGVFVTDNEEIYFKMREFRGINFRKHFGDAVWKWIFFIGQFFALSNPGYSITHFLWKHGVISPFTNYYAGDNVEMPKNFEHKLTEFQARIGLKQLRKLPEIIEKRIQISKRYDNELKDVEGIRLPPVVEGATYSHYVPRVKKREEFISKMAKKGIHAGHHFEYSVPDLKAYNKFKDKRFPNSERCAREVVNLPNFPGLGKEEQDRIIEAVRDSVS